MRLLMLDQSVALVENSVTVTTFLSSLNEGVLLTKMDTCRMTRMKRNYIRQSSHPVCLLNLHCVYERVYYPGHSCAQSQCHNVDSGTWPHSLCVSAKCASSWFHSGWIGRGRCSTHKVSLLRQEWSIFIYSSSALMYISHQIRMED